MKNRTMIAELTGEVGEQATIAGWLYKRRLMGGLNFLLIRDRTGLAQVLVEDEKEIKKLHGLQLGSVVQITGNIVKDDRAPGGSEIHQPKIEVITPVTEVMPIEIDKPISHKPEHLENLFEHRVISLRNTTEQQIFIIQAEIEILLESFCSIKISLHSTAQRF